MWDDEHTQVVCGRVTKWKVSGTQTRIDPNLEHVIGRDVHLDQSHAQDLGRYGIPKVGDLGPAVSQFVLLFIRSHVVYFLLYE